MKKLILLSIVFLAINASHAQPYIPMLQKGNQWNVLQNVGGSGIFYTEIFKLGNDSAYYYNKWWKKIYITTDSSANATFALKTYVREEANGKVYILDTLMQPRLYFDFAASLFDTLILYNTYDIKMDTFIVSQVDTEAYGGLNRKKMNISMEHEDNFYYTNDIWYEGIGSRRGIVYGNPRIYINSDLFLLNCFSHNEQLIYHQPIFPDYPCYINDVGISSIEEKQLKLYPNPVVDYLYIEHLQTQNTIIILYNSFGQCVLQEQLATSNTTLNIQSFKQGMYYYTLINNKGKVISGKFVKE